MRLGHLSAGTYVRQALGMPGYDPAQIERTWRTETSIPWKSCRKCGEVADGKRCGERSGFITGSGERQDCWRPPGSIFTWDEREEPE